MKKSPAQGQGARRLEPEQPAQDHRGRLLAASTTASHGVDAGDVGRGRGGAQGGSPSRSRPPTFWSGSTRWAICSRRRWRESIPSRARRRPLGPLPRTGVGPVPCWGGPRGPPAARGAGGGRPPPARALPQGPACAPPPPAPAGGCRLPLRGRPAPPPAARGGDPAPPPLRAMGWLVGAGGPRRSAGARGLLPRPVGPCLPGGLLGPAVWVPPRSASGPLLVLFFFFFFLTCWSQPRRSRSRSRPASAGWPRSSDGCGSSPSCAPRAPSPTASPCAWRPRGARRPARRGGGCLRADQPLHQLAGRTRGASGSSSRRGAGPPREVGVDVEGEHGQRVGMVGCDLRRDRSGAWHGGHHSAQKSTTGRGAGPARRTWLQ